jgi:hypothetical protein
MTKARFALRAAAIALSLSACAAPRPPAGPVRLYGAEPDPAQTETKFAAGLASRYGATGQKAAIEADLNASGFACTEPPPVEARGDYLMAHCTLARPRGLCTDAWSVDLRYAGQARVAPHGAFRRACVGPAAPKG